MFKHNTDRISTGVIDLRQFWLNEQEEDKFRISIDSDSIKQVLFTKDKNKFKREVLFSAAVPTDKINFLIPVRYDRNTGWSEPLYKLESSPKYIWGYPSYTRMECDLAFKANNSYWKILSIGFPDIKNSWEVPQFKVLTTLGDFRLSIYHSKNQTFCKADQLKNLPWVISSYSANF